MPLLPVERSAESFLLAETRFQVVRQVGVLKQATSNEEVESYASLTGAQRTPCQIASEKALFTRVAVEKVVVKLPPAAKKGRRGKSAKQADTVKMSDRADRSGPYYDRPLFVEERDDHFARTRCSWLPKRDEGPFRGPDDAPYRDTMGFVGPVYVNPPSFWMAMFIQPDELNDE
ncbi:hypothetical protein BU24DRAFT_490540, partial [Aaosphaeria arxii CBS 175.79]